MRRWLLGAVRSKRIPLPGPAPPPLQIESFGFTSTLRAATAGQAFPQCVFDHCKWGRRRPPAAQGSAALLPVELA